jgi:hypothetical protein
MCGINYFLISLLCKIIMLHDVVIIWQSIDDMAADN